MGNLYFFCLSHIDASVVGSVAVCEMLYRTNILAIVGGGRKQKFAENAGNGFYFK